MVWAKTEFRPVVLMFEVFVPQQDPTERGRIFLTKIFGAGTEFRPKDLHRLSFVSTLRCWYLVLWILQGLVCLVVVGKCDWLKAVTCI